jgi:hypothetical protein
VVETIESALRADQASRHGEWGRRVRSFILPDDPCRLPGVSTESGRPRSTKRCQSCC